jgi:hypothetical protein
MTTEEDIETEEGIEMAAVVSVPTIVAPVLLEGVAGGGAFPAAEEEEDMVLQNKKKREE